MDFCLLTPNINDSIVSEKEINDNSDNIILNEKEYKLTLNDVSYNLQMKNDSKYIYFRLYELVENIMPKFYYNKKLDLEKILSTLKLFPDVYNNLNKIFDLFNEAYLQKKLLLSINDDEINLVIKIINGYREVECPIPLKKEKIDINSKFEYIINDIKYLKEINNISLIYDKLLEIEIILKDIQNSTKIKLNENNYKIKELNEKISNYNLIIQNNEKELKTLKNELLSVNSFIKQIKEKKLLAEKTEEIKEEKLFIDKNEEIKKEKLSTDNKEAIKNEKLLLLDKKEEFKKEIKINETKINNVPKGKNIDKENDLDIKNKPIFKKNLRSKIKKKDINKNTIIEDRNFINYRTNEPRSILNKRIYLNFNRSKGLYILDFNGYMKSLLQCLYYIPELREYFIKNKNIFTNEMPMCQALAEVMYGIKYQKHNCFESQEFKKLVESENNLLLSFKNEDLSYNLIDSLLRELKSKEKNEDNNKEEHLYMNKKLESFNRVKNKINKNIVSDLFIGYYETILSCAKRNNINTYLFNAKSYILFNLEKISEYYENNEFEIFDFFEYKFNRTVSSTFFCNICKTNEYNKSFETIFSPPKILVLIIDRGKNQKFKLNFDINLDLDFYIDKIGNPFQLNTKYRLFGVITYSDNNISQNRNFTAYDLNDDGRVYRFNDINIKEIRKDEINENSPYLLFYRNI